MESEYDNGKKVARVKVTNSKGTTFYRNQLVGRKKNDRLKSYQDHTKTYEDVGYGTRVYDSRGKYRDYATDDEAYEMEHQSKSTTYRPTKSKNKVNNKKARLDREISKYQKAVDEDPYNRDARQNLEEAKRERARLNKKK